MYPQFTAMATASAYIINIPEQRRKVILDRVDDFPNATAAEPVPLFSHGKNAALVVFASFKDDKLTHVANGRKGSSAGTGLVRLNMEDLQRLESPIGFDELVRLVPKKFRAPLRRVLESDGLLPPKTLAAVVDVMTKRNPGIAPRLARFSERRAAALRDLRPAEAQNLAAQKESLGLALDIAGLSKAELLAWSPPDGKPATFLEGLPGARVREDVMLIKDFTTVPGFNAIGGASNVAAMTFENPQNRDQQLTVFVANRLPLEEQTGADLIYYNELYRAFVLVQYKAMERGSDGPEYRWQEGDQFMDEIARMDTILAELAKCSADTAPDGYRMCSNPFFLKFCSRMVFNPDDKGLFSGIYLPLDLWKRLNASGKLKGPKDGNVLSFSNVGRRLTNSEFITLVANSWVGTTVPQSAELETGRTVVFALKHMAPPDDEDGPSDGQPSDLFNIHSEENWPSALQECAEFVDEPPKKRLTNIT